MSLLLPPPEQAQIGDIWVDPLTAHRFVFTGENLDDWEYGWVPWDLQNERYEYERMGE
jgi:hypothetical protein